MQKNTMIIGIVAILLASAVLVASGATDVDAEGETKVVYTTDGSVGTVQFYVGNIETIDPQVRIQDVDQGEGKTYSATFADGIITVKHPDYANLDGEIKYWVFPADGSGVYYAEGTFYAGTITFDGNGAEGTMDPVTVGGTYILPACGFDIPTGKEFVGWQVEGAGDVMIAGTEYIVTGTVTLKAVWNEPVDVPVTSVEINQQDPEMTIGDSIKLTVTVLPENATDKNVVWTTSNDKVATVDQNGLVTAVGEGTAIITVTTVSGGFTDTCNVSVEDIPPTVVDVTGVTLDKTEMALFDDNKTGILVATVLPSNATNKNVTWTSSDPTVATVQGGVVTPLKAGTTTIMVTTENGGFTATCNVTVTAVAPDHIVVEPVDTVYEVGETYNGDVKVTLVYNNGTLEAVPEGGYTVSPETIDTSIPGTYDVTVMYPGLEPVTYQVVVKAPGQVAITVTVVGGGLFGGAVLHWDNNTKAITSTETVVVDEGTVVTLNCDGLFTPTVMVDGQLVDTPYVFTASADVTVTVMFPADDDDDDDPFVPPVVVPADDDDDTTTYVVAIAAAAVVAILAALILMQTRKS